MHGNVVIDDYASINAAAGTDGIRGYNFGTGTITITAEAGAVIAAGEYGIAAISEDQGHVSVTNYATVTAATAILAKTAGTGTATIDNHGTLTGAVNSHNATFTNESGAVWNLTGSSMFSGTSTIGNAGTIDITGDSATLDNVIVSNSDLIQVDSGNTATFNVEAFTNSGTVTLQDSTLDIGGNVVQNTMFYLSVSGTLSTGLVENSGVINDTGIASELFVQGTVTLDGGTLNIGSSGTVDQASLLWNYDPDGVGAILTLDASLTINVVGNAGFYSTSGSSTVQDWIDNDATINTSSSAAPGSLFYIQPDHFLNYGAINASTANLTVLVEAASGTHNAGTITASNGGAVDFEELKLSNQVLITETGTVVDNNNTSTPSHITAATLLTGIAGPNSNDLGTVIANDSVLNVNANTITFSASQTDITTDGSGNVTIGIGTGSTLTVQDVLNAIDGITGGGLPSTVSSGELILSDDPTISGGTGNALAALGLSTITSATHVGIIDADGGTITLDTGHTITNAGLLEATNGGILDVEDTAIFNSGVAVEGSIKGILVDATSELLVDTSTLTLNGHGDVTLQGGEIAAQTGNTLLTTPGSYLTLDNYDNTISGTGQIGDGTTSDLMLHNEFRRHYRRHRRDADT